MERLTIPDVKIDEKTTKRAFVDGDTVRACAMEFYWRLKKIEDILEPATGLWMRLIVAI